eukprot:488916_1
MQLLVDIKLKIRDPAYQNGIKLLHKIFLNIIKNPNKQKYQDLKTKIICQKLEKCDILLQLLLQSGFNKSNNDQRLIFDVTKLDYIKDVNKQLFQFTCLIKLHEGTKQLVSMGWEENKARIALATSRFDVQTVIKEENKMNAAVKRMKSMGFEETRARLSLIKSNCNVQAAVNNILYPPSNKRPISIDNHTCDISNCQSFKQIRTILQKYQLFIISNQQNNKRTTGSTVVNINEIYGYEYNNTKLLNDFNHLLLKHGKNQQFENIYNLLIRSFNDKWTDSICNTSRCLIIRRHYRDRKLANVDDKTLLDELYFDCDEKEIVQQQLLDRIHCHYFHSYDTGYKIRQQDINNLQQNELEVKVQNNDEVISGRDSHLINIGDIIQREKNKIKKISGLEVLCNNKDKFMLETGNEVNKTSDVFSFGYRYFYWDYYKNNKDIYEDDINERSSMKR